MAWIKRYKQKTKNKQKKNQNKKTKQKKNLFSKFQLIPILHFQVMRD